MPLLDDITIGAINSDDSQKQIESLIRQLNEWGRTISNQGLTTIYNDTSGTPRIIIGMLPDNTMGLVISKEGIDVLSAFS